MKVKKVYCVQRVCSSIGIWILLSMANFFSALYLVCQIAISCCMVLLCSDIASMSLYSCDFSVSNSSFCSIRFIRQLAAYPRFFNVLRRCFIRTISSRESPLSFSWRFRSLTEIVTSSSSLMSRQGPGESGS